MGAFSTSLSGVEAASQDLSVISNNLANLNTTGYKSEEANFQDFFYQKLGSDGAGDPIQIGAGSVIASVVSGFSQGTISSTGVPTDMAIQGSGFFVVQSGASTFYTRAGNFSQDDSGYLVTSDGADVLGYPATNGVISPSQTLAPIQLANGEISAPAATTTMELTMNLDASATPSTSTAATSSTGTLTVSGNATDGEQVTVDGTTYTLVSSITGDNNANDVLIDSTSAANTLTNLADAIDGTGTAGTNYTSGTSAVATVNAVAGQTTLTITAAQTGIGGNSIGTTSSWGSFGGADLTGGAVATSTSGSASSTFSEPMVVYDSLGTSHNLTFTFNMTAQNTWSYQITIPAADVGGGGSPVVIKNGTLQFDNKGNLQSPTTDITGISVPTLADGAKGLDLSWQLLNPTTNVPNVTQVAGKSNVSGSQADGYTSGALQSFTINKDGTIQGVFSNGQTLTLGQIAIATFQNTEGLQLNGSNTYLASPNAGIPSIGAPNGGGRGSIVGQSLESSNVDMTSDLSNLIVAERDYQANAKAISTSDQMVSFVLNMQT